MKNMRRLAQCKKKGNACRFLVARDARVRLFHKNALPQLEPRCRVRRPRRFLNGIRVHRASRRAFGSNGNPGPKRACTARFARLFAVRRRFVARPQRPPPPWSTRKRPVTARPSRRRSGKYSVAMRIEGGGVVGWDSSTIRDVIADLIIRSTKSILCDLGRTCVARESKREIARCDNSITARRAPPFTARATKHFPWLQTECIEPSCNKLD
jgi:hypothetical protein